MKLNQDKIQRMFNGQGSVAGGGGSSFDPSLLFGLATEQWTEENYVSKTFFNELFVIHKLTTTVVYDENDQEISRTTSKLGTFLPNELPSETETVDEETGYKTVVTTAVDNIEAKKGVWTNFFMSALGLNDAGGGGGVGDVTWDALEDDTDYRQIALSHLTTALQNYATQTWVQTQGYVTQSAISDMATKTWVGQQGFLTSSAISDMATKTWVGQQGYLTAITSSMIATALGYTPANNADLSNYLPLTGGTLTGNLTISTNTLGGYANAPLKVTSSASSSNSWLASFLNPNMSIGGNSLIMVGKENADSKSAWFGYAETSTGTGFATIGLYNKDRLLNVFSNGNVGIGTDSPSCKLDVNGNIQTSSSNGSYIKVGALYIGYDQTNNAIRISANADGTGSANLYASGGVSALGQSSSGGGGVGDVTWELLADNTDTRQIALSHLTTALNGYATQQWVGQQGFLTSITSSMITTALGYTPANSSSLSNYLPLSGGTIEGRLTVHRTDSSSSEVIYPLIINRTTSATSKETSIDFQYDGTSKFVLGFWISNNVESFFLYSRRMGAQALTIKGDNGYMGIGQTSPAYKLDVNGDVRATNFRGALVGNADSATYATSAGSAPASDVYAWAKASTKPSYSFSEITGSISSTQISASTITTALGYTPVNKAGDTMTGQLIVSRGSYPLKLLTSGSECSFILASSGSTNMYGNYVVGCYTGSTSGSPAFFIYDTNLGKQTFHLENNRLGIGTAAIYPDYTLQVGGAIYSTTDITANSVVYANQGIELNTGGYSSSNGGYIDFHYAGSSRDYTTRIIEDEENILSIMGISNTSGSAVRAGLKVGDGYNASYIQIGNIRLVYNDSTNSIRVVRYDGTAANLYATGGISALGISSSSDGTVSASLIPSTTGTYALGSSSYGWKYIYLSSNSSNSYTGTISVDGDGINLISNNGGYLSGTRFLVNGRLVVNESDDVYPSYALYVNGNTYCDGSISASNVINRSDMRLKEVLDDLKLDLQTIANAPLFKFTFRKGERRVMVGTSAQYWQVLLPEAVFADADGMLGLDYGVTALASAISLAREVSEHDRRIAALEAENMVLRAEIKNLKAA